MITLTFITDTEPYILELEEETWKFSINMRNDGQYDNMVILTNLYRSFITSQDILDCGEYLRNNKESIKSLIVEVNGHKVFDSELLKLKYHNVHFYYRINPTLSAQDVTNSYDLGFNFNIVFSRKEENDEEDSLNEGNIEE